MTQASPSSTATPVEGPTVDRALLRVRGIVKSFGGVRALDHASFDVEPGEVHTLLGENGAGKSTLVKIIAGVFPPDAGEQIWEGTTIRRLDIPTASRLGIRVIYQRLSTVPHLSVEENLSLGREPSRFGVVRRREARREAREALARVGADLDLDRQAGSLPIAERQLIEIARAMRGECRLLVMDEPTASLGEREVEQLFAVVRGLRDEGVAIVFISHKLAEITAISDRVTVLRDGRTIGTVIATSTTPSQLVEMMVGRDLAAGFDVERARPSAEVVLSVEDLWTETGLCGIDLTLHQGEILGVYGLMGSGRTELARALFGADRILSGTLSLDGNPVHPGSPSNAKRLGLGFVPEERPQAVFEDMSVLENISSASGDRIAHFGIVQRSTERLLATRIFSKLDVRAPSIDVPLRSLSGGNQQKVVLGKWLMRESRVLILDDPTSGVDVGAKQEIYRLIVEHTRAGASVIMSSSELPELLAIANRILVLHQGRVAGLVDGEGMNQRDVLHLAVRGMAADGADAAGHPSLSADASPGSTRTDDSVIP